ncbi:MAG: hypothetical protein HRT38_17190 [Alteromonadaceae bacterium]|nr:hypothetical protein [Alteromonadaceae bacterium]
MKELPVIAMTAHVMPADIERSRQAGMNDHISKPIDTDAFYSTLAKYLKVVERGHGQSGTGNEILQAGSEI